MKRQMVTMFLLSIAIGFLILITYVISPLQPEKRTPSNNVAIQFSSLTAEEIYKRVSGSVYAIYGADSDNNINTAGSAIAVTTNDLATNCHIISGMDHFIIKVDGIDHKGILYSQHGDLCIITSPDVKLKPVKMRPSKDVNIGEVVYALGNPYLRNKTISNGIISNKFILNGRILLQTNAAISSGSSGGGLFDKDGNLIGITTILSVANDMQNMNIALPTETIMAALLEPKVESDENVSTAQTKNNAPLTLIGLYGDSKVGLYKKAALCVISITGRSENGTNRSIFIWSPSVPHYFYIFPSVNTTEQAFGLLEEYMNIKAENRDYKSTNSYLILNDKTFQLSSKPTQQYYNVLQGYFPFNPIKSFINDDFFVTKFSDNTNDIYGLKGFTDALSAYYDNCSDQEG